jgi:hypothetical protein
MLVQDSRQVGQTDTTLAKATDLLRGPKTGARPGSGMERLVPIEDRYVVALPRS